jgi:hypothetical protein
MADWTWDTISDTMTWDDDTWTWEEQNDDGTVNRGPVVFSDLKILSVAIDEGDFITELTYGSMAGYQNWRAFVAGDYQFQKGAFRYILNAFSTDRPRVSAMQFVVDVPDLYDRGKANISAGSGEYEWVAFNRTFTSTNSLAVAAVLIGGTELATVRIRDGGTVQEFLPPDGTFTDGSNNVWTFGAQVEGSGDYDIDVNGSFSKLSASDILFEASTGDIWAYATATGNVGWWQFNGNVSDPAWTLVYPNAVKDPFPIGPGITTTGFYVRLEAADGSFPAGTISWTAQGY